VVNASSNAGNATRRNTIHPLPNSKGRTDSGNWLI
jgi:hypothetical protein